MVECAPIVHPAAMRSRWWSALLLVAVACGDDEGGSPLGLDGGEAGVQPNLDAGPMDLDARAADAAGEVDRCHTREERVAVSSAFHVAGDVQYADPPPVGGDHNQCWARWGVHEIEVPDENWVHNLEHGGVVFLYNCPGGCADEVETMKVYVTGRTQAMLLPYAALPTRFALVAWGVRLMTDCFDMPRFQRFYTTNVDNGLESIASDPPRSCR